MRVQEIMTQPVQTVPPAMAAGEAWELMRRLRVHHLIVKDGASIVGVLSDRDLGSYRGKAIREGRRVKDLMIDSVVTIDQTETIRRAANLMRGRSIGCLPVTKNGRIAGILTLSDLLDVLGHGGDRPAAASRASLQYRVKHGKQKQPGRRAW
jgi:CBS domain-containing protein